MICLEKTFFRILFVFCLKKCIFAVNKGVTRQDIEQ